MRTLVILNPTAGGRTGAKALRRRLEARIRAEFAESSEPGAATRIAEEAARSGYDRVIAAGGDGTIREVACGLYRGGGGPRLGIVPAGTGNDLAFGIDLPADVDRAVAVACGERTVALDLIEARAGGREDPAQVAANAVVAGFCGRIADSMNPRLRRGLRRVAYPLAALSQLRDLGPYRVRLEVDGRRLETEALMIVVANGACAGGRVPLAPGADPTDGVLDVVVMHAVRPWKLTGLVPRVLLGRHTGHAGVSTFRGKTIQIESDPPMWMNLDGDTWQAGPASFRVLPGVLHLAVR